MQSPVLPVDLLRATASAPLGPDERDELAARFKALADPTRVAIVEPALGYGRGLRLRPECGVRAVAADDLAPPEDPPRGRARRVVSTRHVGVLPARARGDRCAAGCARRSMNVLFVCRQNAGRSQIAQALYERRGGSARSAGTTPAQRRARRGRRAHAGARRPRAEALEQADAEWADLVVTMGCGDACPVIPGKRYVDWDLQDPAGQDADDGARDPRRDRAPRRRPAALASRPRSVPRRRA